MNKCLNCNKEINYKRKFCSKNCKNIYNRTELPKNVTVGEINNYKIYKRWAHMIKRCYYEKDISYKNYGARGIYVCDDWFDYSTFEKWCLNNNYREDLQLDRINNNDCYCPQNCRFVDRTTNNRNRNITKKVFLDGKEYTLGQLSQKYNIKYKTLWQRLNRDKKDIKDAIREVF